MMARKYVTFMVFFSLSLVIPKLMLAQDDLLNTNRPIRSSRQLILTVGQDKGDLQGKDDKTIQAGIEYLHRLGGGILQIYPGIYQMNNALYLRPNIILRGSGKNTVLRKTDGVETLILRDMDWYEYAVQVKDVKGFVTGGGIMLRSRVDSSDWAFHVFRGTIKRIEGNVLFLDNMPYENFWVQEDVSATTIFPIITAAEHIDNVIIEDIVLDGNKANNELMNGNYTGAVFIQNCDNWKFNNVTSQNYDGDGYSFQVCDDIHFDNCKSLDNNGLGFHPGSGSQRPVFRNCTSTGNDLGIFFCWGVSHGLAENCMLSNNHKYGISIGHRDTDNLITGCKIENNGEVGIYFREPSGVNNFRAGNRNTIIDCEILNNGKNKTGTGIDIGWEIEDISIKNNRIGNTNGQNNQQTGIRISEDAKRISLEANTFLDSPVEVEDHHLNKQEP
jgi:hypothetical protein